MVNKANLQLKGRVIKTISDNQTELRRLKTKQFVGADNLTIDSSLLHEITVTLPPFGTTGWLKTVIVNWSRPVNEQYQAEFRCGFYIDHDTNPAYLWPDGASLSSDEYLFEGFGYEDSLHSSEEFDGTKCFVLCMKNFGTASKTVSAYLELIYPEGAVE